MMGNKCDLVRLKDGTLCEERQPDIPHNRKNRPSPSIAGSPVRNLLGGQKELLAKHLRFGVPRWVLVDCHFLYTPPSGRTRVRRSTFNVPSSSLRKKQLL